MHTLVMQLGRLGDVILTTPPETGRPLPTTALGAVLAAEIPSDAEEVELSRDASALWNADAYWNQDERRQSSLVTTTAMRIRDSDRIAV